MAPNPMKKLIILFFTVLFFSGCVVITFKEQNIYINDSQSIDLDSDISGSDPSGNDVSPKIDIPLIP